MPPKKPSNPPKPDQPRTVFVRLRALFDEMTPAERQTAIAMWGDWIDMNDPETPLWGEQNKE